MKKPPVPTGMGEYANRSEGHKLYSKSRRRISKLSLELLSIGEAPKWLITFNYPNGRARKLTPEILKTDLRCFRKFVRRNYPGLGIGYLIDWSTKAKHHIHLLIWGRTQKTDKRKRPLRRLPGSQENALIKFSKTIRKWWVNRVKCKKKSLVDVSYLPNTDDGIRARNYLITETKIKAHMQVVVLLGKKHGFGFFNKKNIPFLPVETWELTEEEFSEYRKLFLADLKKSKRGCKASNKRHKKKLRKAKAHRHVCHDQKLSKKIKIKLRRRQGK
ncbi:MAG: hypothetical protein JEY79_12790 [Pseudodesulfovibrio sp.]|nr:hypothetical protein [Pseudodesulfovibrio sp.]